MLPFYNVSKLVNYHEPRNETTCLQALSDFIRDVEPQFSHCWVLETRDIYNFTGFPRGFKGVTVLQCFKILTHCKEMAMVDNCPVEH